MLPTFVIGLREGLDVPFRRVSRRSVNWWGKALFTER